MNRSLSVAPTHSLWGGIVDVYALGCPHDWSVANPANHPTIFEFVFDVAGCQRVLCPRPVFNAQVVSAGELPEQSNPPRSDGAQFLRGADADGAVLLEANEAYWLSSGDCLTTVLFDTASGQACALHCGRDAILDRQLIATNNASRDHHSVVELALSRMANPSAVRAFMCCGIGARHFEHPLSDPKHGQANAFLVEYVRSHFGPQCIASDTRGAISLSEIVRAQLIRLGVPPDAIGSDAVDTYADCQPDGSFQWWSNRRGDAYRNGVLVVRRA